MVKAELIRTWNSPRLRLAEPSASNWPNKAAGSMSVYENENAYSNEPNSVGENTEVLYNCCCPMCCMHSDGGPSIDAITSNSERLSSPNGSVRRDKRRRTFTGSASREQAYTSNQRKRANTDLVCRGS